MLIDIFTSKLLFVLGRYNYNKNAIFIKEEFTFLAPKISLILEFKVNNISLHLIKILKRFKLLSLTIKENFNIIKIGFKFSDSNLTRLY